MSHDRSPSFVSGKALSRVNQSRFLSLLALILLALGWPAAGADCPEFCGPWGNGRGFFALGVDAETGEVRFNEKVFHSDNLESLDTVLQELGRLPAGGSEPTATKQGGHSGAMPRGKRPLASVSSVWNLLSARPPQSSLSL